MTFAPLRSHLEQSRIALFRLAQRADAFCARLNPGLLAFATTLTLFLVVLWVARHPEISDVDYQAAVAASGIVE